MDPFEAIEMDNIQALKDALDGGADVNSVKYGLTLLQYALDSEMDAVAQVGAPLHVDATALILARGADPDYVPLGGISATHMAFQGGHWLALELFKLWRRVAR